MPLVARPPKPWPAPYAWATGAPELGLKIIQRAWVDIGMLETPLGSNRGAQIDVYLRRAGVPESLITTGKGWWCAAWVGCVWMDAGAKVPNDFASCDAWLPYLESKGYAPKVGDALLYGVKGDAHHIGIVARLDPMVLTIEGNRGFAGTTNNGVAVDIAPPMRRDILGYVRPQPT